MDTRAPPRPSSRVEPRKSGENPALVILVPGRVGRGPGLDPRPRQAPGPALAAPTPASRGPRPGPRPQTPPRSSQTLATTCPTQSSTSNVQSLSEICLTG